MYCNEVPVFDEERPIFYDESPDRICPILPSEARQGRALSFSHSLFSWNFWEFRGKYFHADGGVNDHVKT
jgi:hypothetical protein